MIANPAVHKAKRPRLISSHLILVSVLLSLTLVVGVVCAWLMVQTVASYYASRVYPNVYVMGLKLGRLTPEEATALVQGSATQVDTGILVLHDGENRWSVPWSEAGMQMDTSTTVQAAFAVGHSGVQSWRDQAQKWLGRHDVAPVFSVNPEQARRLLQSLAPSVALAPSDASIRLPEKGDGQVVIVPSQPGRELDVQATLSQLLDIADDQGQSRDVDLIFRAVPPRFPDAASLAAQAEELLNRQVEVVAFDLVADESFAWSLGRGDVVSWLHITSSPDGPVVTLDRNAIPATLAKLNAELGEGRGFRTLEASEQIAHVFVAGGGTVSLDLTHPVRSTVVQAGDSLSSIAADFGMTCWHLMQANPGIDFDWLRIGQELTIPSQDELTPFSPIPGKRIVVSTAEQRLRAYEDGELIFDWPISTGIAESPTHTGVFQILDKEENAYASLWDLWMPHFMAIYAAGPGFFNGFHGLPTLSSGRLLWEGLLGSPASYGCIILGLEEAETLYQWVEVGVVVVVE